MTSIVSTITPASEQSIWSIEASYWRLPYWDWAADQPYLQNVGVPQLFTLPQVTVVMPNSKSATFNNPLWKFSNPKGVAMGDSSMKPWALTAQPVSLIFVKLPSSQLTPVSSTSPSQQADMPPSIRRLATLSSKV